jgi:hypothetical protein
MRFFRAHSTNETLPPTESEINEDRESEFRQVLAEHGIQHIELKLKSHENHMGLHLFVRLHKCSVDDWSELHGFSENIKKRLRSRGMGVAEIFYSLCN